LDTSSQRYKRQGFQEPLRKMGYSKSRGGFSKSHRTPEMKNLGGGGNFPVQLDNFTDGERSLVTSGQLHCQLRAELSFEPSLLNFRPRLFPLPCDTSRNQGERSDYYQRQRNMSDSPGCQGLWVSNTLRPFY
jgi:hypothetical protein